MRMGARFGALMFSVVGLAACDGAGILEPEEGAMWVAVAAGGAHSCALTEDGHIACFGSNYSGQLGIGEGISYSSLPALVPSAERFQSVAVGEGHSCAIDVQGEVWCWGDNQHGQLGDGTLTDRYDPVRTTAGSEFVALALGSRHTCALDSEGVAVCWGENRRGQVGIGTFSEWAHPAPVQSGEIRFSRIAAGDLHTCGVHLGGEGFCWGSNHAGQLGAWNLEDASRPVLVSGGFLFHEIATGADHSCAVRSIGEVRCWGGNAYRQIGNYSGSFSGSPQLTGRVDNAYIVGAALRPWSCATNGIDPLLCWGIRVGEEVAEGIPIASGGWSPLSPGLVGEEIVQMDLGGLHGCLLTGEGEIYCWGEGGDGQLGNGERGSAPTAVRVGR